LEVLRKIQENQESILYKCTQIPKQTEVDEFIAEENEFERMLSYQYFSLQVIIKWIEKRVDIVKSKSIKRIMLDVIMDLNSAKNNVKDFAEKSVPKMKEIKELTGQNNKEYIVLIQDLEDITNKNIFDDDTKNAIQLMEEIVNLCRKKIKIE